MKHIYEKRGLPGKSGSGPSQGTAASSREAEEFLNLAFLLISRAMPDGGHLEARAAKKGETQNSPTDVFALRHRADTLPSRFAILVGFVCSCCLGNLWKPLKRKANEKRKQTSMRNDATHLHWFSLFESADAERVGGKAVTLLPRRVRCAWWRAIPTQRARVPEQARGITSPLKN